MWSLLPTTNFTDFALPPKKFKLQNTSYEVMDYLTWSHVVGRRKPFGSEVFFQFVLLKRSKLKNPPSLNPEDSNIILRPKAAAVEVFTLRHPQG